MDYDLYKNYLEQYALEALEESGDDVSRAADILSKKKKPSFFARHRREKREALSRLKKLFNESRDRPAWIVLKSLGLDDLAKDRI
jgi:hypothetical protein